jgi:threonine/homoserine/homoserine lactone efflux protein
MSSVTITSQIGAINHCHNKVSVMKRVALLVLLTFLCALNFYAAFSPDWSRRYFSLFIRSDALRKVVQLFFGVVLILCVLLLIYGALNPRG